MIRVSGTKSTAAAASVPMAEQLRTELRCHRARMAELGLQHVTPGPGLHHDPSDGAPEPLRAGDLAGLNADGVERIGCHDLRHSCAGLLFAAGRLAPEVASMLRHADSRVTLMVYAGIVETDPRGEAPRGLVAAFGQRFDLKWEPSRALCGPSTLRSVER